MNPPRVSAEPPRREWVVPLLPLLLLAGGLRLILISRSQMLNPDGMVYILQAKAIYLGQWKQLLSAYPWPTNLAPLLAGARHLTGDWLTAGRLVSNGFSLATTIPLYFFLRRHCERLTAAALTLLYVTSPEFIRFGNEIIRGPEFWFFLCCGLWGMARILHPDESRPPATPIYILTSIALLLAAWSRIEGIWALLLATLWLLAGRRRHGLLRLAAWLLPGLLLPLLIVVPVANGWSHFLPHCNSLYAILQANLLERLHAAHENYHWLQQALHELQKTPPPGVAPYFFKELRQHLPVLALILTGEMLWRLGGWAYWLLVIYGWRQLRGLLRTALYPLLLGVGTGLILFAAILLRWSPSPRFAAQVYFPGLLLAMPGAGRLLGHGASAPVGSRVVARRHLLPLLALILALIALSSLLHRNRTERSVVFKEIGLALARSELIRENAPLRLCGTSRKILYSHFFAYLESDIIVSPNDFCTITTCAGLDPDRILQQDCSLVLLSDRDGGRTHFLELVERRADLQATVLIDKPHSPLHGQVTLFQLRKVSLPVDVN